MGQLVIVTGPPGAGKSTIAGHLAERLNPSALVPADWFSGLWRRGAIPAYLPEAQPQAAVASAAAAATAGTFARAGCAAVVDGLVRPLDLPRFLAAAGHPPASYVVLRPPVDVCVERVLRRYGNGFTSEETARALHAEFSVDGLDRYVVDESDLPANDLAALLVERVTAGGFTVPAHVVARG